LLVVELEYLQSWLLPLLSLLLLSNRQEFSGGDWVTGQIKPLFETFASALLAGI
jgi:sorbitol-specific phosphotransferase system component IIC